MKIKFLVLFILAVFLLCGGFIMLISEPSQESLESSSVIFEKLTAGFIIILGFFLYKFVPADEIDAIIIWFVNLFNRNRNDL